jgi:hypothetical protein
MIACKGSLGGNWIRYTELTEVLFSTGAIEGGRDATEVMSSVTEVLSTRDSGSVN